MVKQGDIIKINFNPQSGHEQAGYRPALVISGDEFNKRTKLAIVCPISNTSNDYPLHLPLDSFTKTTGKVLCQHIRTLDIYSRGYELVEKISRKKLKEVLNIIYAELEME